MKNLVNPIFLGPKLEMPRRNLPKPRRDIDTGRGKQIKLFFLFYSLTAQYFPFLSTLYISISKIQIPTHLSVNFKIDGSTNCLSAETVIVNTREVE